MEQLRQQLIAHEGIVLKPYRCTAGYLTVGVGRNLEQRGISPTEANYLLDNDIAHFEKLVKSHIDVSQCNPARTAVLINMAFNLGINGLLTFKNAIAAVEAQNYTLAADQMLDSKWATQVGYRAISLAKQMDSGVWQ